MPERDHRLRDQLSSPATLGARILIAIAASSTAALLVVAVALVFHEVATFETRVSAELRARARPLSVPLDAALRFEDARMAAQALAALDDAPEIGEARAFTSSGRLFARWERSPRREPAPFPDIPPSGSWTGDRHMDLVAPVRLSGEEVGRLHIRYDVPSIGARLSRHGLLGAVALLSLITAGALGAGAVARLANAALASAEERRRLAVESGRIGIWDWDLETDQVALSELASEIYGADASYPGTLAWFADRIHPSDRQDFAEGVADFRRGISRDLEYRVRRPDGSVRRVVARGQVYADERGRRMAGVVRDVTEARDAEEKAAESRHFISKIADSLPAILYVHDVETGRPAYVNAEVRAILGIEPSEIPASRPVIFADRVHQDDAGVVKDRAARVLAAEDGAIVESTCRLRHADGTERWISSRETVFQRGADGKPRLVLGIAHDVTKTQDLQRQVMQAQKMESIGRLAGGIAHDFNNLLTVIIGCTQLAQGPVPPASARRHLESVLKAGQQAAELTRQLLAFSRQQVVTPKLVSLNEVLLESERIIRRLVGEDISVRTVPKPGVGVVRADKGHVVQVLMNLAANARDAMPRGGILTIATDEATLEAGARAGLAAGRYVALTVSDTGSGMSDEVKARIFEPFFTTKELGKGTGLGLATCYGVVSQAGGHIEIESGVGVGTTFRVLLPRAGDAAASDGAPVKPAGAGPGASHPRRRSATILIVEDNPLVRETVLSVLDAQGFVVMQAADAGDALRLSEGYTGKIDVLISDIVMPGMDGCELSRDLARRRPDMRIILTSGYTDPGTLARMSDGPPCAFLPKPYPTSALLDKIHQVLPREVVA